MSPATPTAGRRRHRVRRLLSGGLGEFLRFAVIGGAGLVTDVGVFTLLRSETLGLLDHKPITCKVVSVVVATLVTWLGNRYWTYRHRTTASVAREVVLFAVMNAVAAGIALACLAVSHYLLGFRSLLADNVAANGVGLVLGMAFRFVAYRYVVFRDVADGGAPSDGREPEPEGLAHVRATDVPPSDDVFVPAVRHREAGGDAAGRPGKA